MAALTELQELASPLVGATSLIEIRLFESHGRHIKFPDDPDQVRPSDLDVTIESAGGDDSPSAIYLLRAEMTLQESRGADEDHDALEDVASFSVAFGALYGIDADAQDLPRESREAFGQCVAALALWPYVRAEMARLSEAMHSPVPLTLPMLTQQDLVELSQ